MDTRRILVCALTMVVLPTLAIAATEAEKRAAINSGLVWLTTQQQSDGHFESGDIYYDTTATGSALLAFLQEGFQAGDDVIIGGTNYGDVVGNGMDYLLGRATIYNISPEPTGNPDGDGNGVGVKFVSGDNNVRDTYVTGTAMPAIAASGTPDKVVTVGPLAGRTDGSGPAGAWTYRDVVQNTVDYFAYGQSDPGNTARGGWRYYADYAQSDNSTAQWPAISMLFAQEMGVTAPQFVKDELKHWIDYIQYNNPGHSLDGSSGYNSPTYLNNESKTGGLLLEMAFAGSDLQGNAYDLSHPNVQAALAYLNREWQDGPSGTWNGNFGHPYAMWSIYKGLETIIGLDDTSHITNLHAADIMDEGDTWNWFEDYCDWLVDNQTTGGYWSGYSNWGPDLATAWNINILAATEIPHDDPVPEPLTMITATLGLAGLGRYVRRRRRV